MQSGRAEYLGEAQGVDEDSIIIQMPGYRPFDIPISGLLDPEYQMRQYLIEHYRQTGEIPDTVASERAELREAKTLFGNYRTAVTCLLFNGMGTNAVKKERLVAQTVSSWNRTVSWLHEMDLLRRAGSFRAG